MFLTKPMCVLASVLAISISATRLAAADFFPLAPGNEWTYVAVDPQGRNTTKTIRVSLPVVIGQHVYHYVHGYAPERMLVRKGEDGNLYMLNEESENYASPWLLTRFQPEPRGYYNTPIGGHCPVAAEVQEKRVPVRFSSESSGDGAVRIVYSSMACADAGLTEELYLENIGLISRTELTIAGPVRYELASARINGMTINTRPGSSFTVQLNQAQFRRWDASVVPLMQGSIVLQVNDSAPLKLVFPSSQRYDLRLKDESGRTLQVWSADKLFLQVISEITVDRELRLPFEMPLSDQGHNSLRDGTYTLEAWLATAGEERLFSVETAVTLSTAQPEPATAK